MYKNAHLQNITPGPKVGMEVREDLISQSWHWKKNRGERLFGFFPLPRGTILIASVQNRPCPKSRPSFQGSHPLMLTPN